MVDVNVVYKKVLTISNKEQRGYITPQEFNLLADKAQLDIINNHFHAFKMAQLKPKNQTEAFDEGEMLREKLSYIKTRNNSITISSGGLVSIPKSCYMIATAYLNTGGDNGLVEITEVDMNRLLDIKRNPLTAPVSSRPVFVRRTNLNPSATNTSQQAMIMEIHPDPIDTGSSSIRLEYFVRPVSPNWSYVVVSEKPLYNYNNSTHFILSPSDEEALVTRILQLAGVAIESPELQQAIAVDKQQTRQEQNS
tara:strand:- start:27698 stop:28450 length:753 start_codon:yes stop_codon:yes gene_type:complete